MSRPVGQLLEEALNLSDHDRAALAARLIESLDPEVDDDATTAWGDEIRRRLGELDRGESAAIPWPEARSMILSDADEPAQG
jgi:putative addiction module component (TIGR02574 family)